MPGEPEGIDALRAALLARGIHLGVRVDSGAAATVYEGDDARHQRRVAIKVLDPVDETGAPAERFTREIALVAGLQHPHIVPLYDSGEIAGLQYYIMPFATGESLRDRLAREGRLPLSVAVRLGIEIADALGYAHQRGVVHRDVKPANILSDAGHFLLADFGIAAISRRPMATAGTSPALTGQGSFIGTLEYMAPEQILGEAVDGRADLYALASVVFEAISGRLPFIADSPRRLAQGKLSGAHASLDQLVPGTPSGLSQLIDLALAADPVQRPGSVTEFQAALEVFRVPTGAAHARRWSVGLFARRSLLLGGVLVLALAGTVWWLAAMPRLDSRRVVVAGFTNETSKPGLVVFGDRIETWITDSLAHLGTIRVITSAVELPIRRPQGPGGPETSPERIAAVARETRAGTVVTGSFFERAGQLEVSVEVTDARSGELRVAIGPVRGTESNMDQLVEQVGGEVVRAVDSLFNQRRGTSAESNRSVSPSKSPPR